MQNSSFSNFYQEYLGLADSVICNGVRLCKSKYRDIPINKKYFYKVIATKYNGEKIISYSPDINETELKSLSAKINFEAIGLGDIPYDLNVPYKPTIKNLIDGTVLPLDSYVKSCISTGETYIHAKPLEKSVKVFTEWDEEKYMLGRVNDYIAVRSDDRHDIYIIENNIFQTTYEECKES